ncbi:crotonase/enoyl-CoA hydratase family protein [Thioalkalivibrio sp. XN279]|uniref:crotonase/enoyl-CoA hydratase family protein n=1 Tax=Thioalkalivibrio sp. XN279 TaxID=2714953 RepID=UPI00140A7501|nr:crotonase/enoyl-CoA hydratase family protein [Thioalkalivibrio sp. XN279]NHA14371.1 crotonase/enoyl-CoA hydratase family protein [Thioalkalivibrio sp. XN279]
MSEPIDQTSPRTVESTRQGHVTVISLARPGVRNAVDPATALQLYHAMLAFEADADAAVAVLTGSGDSFCAGFDLKTLAAGQADAWLAQLHFGERGEPPLGPMGPTRLRLSKPVIAAIAGPAVAGGMELALWCDLRVMERSAWMGVLCRRWGVPLIDGGTVRLPRIVGLGRALDLVLSGRRIDAEECLAIGLCDRVVEHGAALSAALALAAALAEAPQACLRSDRDALRYGVFPDEMAALQAEFAAGLDALRTEARDGAAAFSAGQGRHGAPPR